MTDRQTDGWMDGQTEALTISPLLFYKSMGIKIFILLEVQSTLIITTLDTRTKFVILTI